MFNWFRGQPQNGLNNLTKSSNRRMLQQFRDRVDCDLLEIDRDALNDATSQKIFETARGIVDTEIDKLTWQKLYQAELLLASLMPLAKVTDFTVRQIAFLKILRPEAYADYLERLKALRDTNAPHAVPAANEDALRSLLKRVLDDVHWAYAQRYENRLLLRRYTVGITFGALAIIVLFIVCLVTLGEFKFTLGPYTGLALAVGAGLVGSSFSVLSGAKPDPDKLSVEEMKRVVQFGVILLRLTVGGVAATILYFFFESGWLGGDLLPELDAINFTRLPLPPDLCTDILKTLTSMSDEHQQEVRNAIAVAIDDEKACVAEATGEAARINHVPNSDLSKLLVWSFAAGFSEKLVKSLLARVQDKPAA